MTHRTPEDKYKTTCNRAAAALLGTIFLAAALSGCGGGGGSNRIATPTGTQQQAPGAGIVAGAIFTTVAGRSADSSTGAKLPVAAVTVTCAAATGATGPDGSFSVPGVPAGKQTCSLSKQGYLVSQFSVDVVAGQTTTVTPADLTPENAGVLQVNTEPSGASVIIDGFEVAATTTNVLLDPVIAGSHEISVRLAGYEQATTTVQIEKDASATAEFKLVKLTTSISVSWDGAAVPVGAEKQLSASCAYADGSTADCASALSWESSATSVVTVSQDGKLTAAAPGTAVISATRAQSRITFPGITVTVACPDGKSWDGSTCSGDTLSSITIDPPAATVQQGNALNLTAKCVWAKAGEAPCPALDWVSNVPTAASVANNGSVSALAPGLTTVTASASGVTSNAAAVTIPVAQNPEPTCEGVSTLCVDITGASTSPGGALNLEVRIYNIPSGGIRGGSITLTWDPSALSYSAINIGTGITLQAENSSAPGKYQLAFTCAEPVTANSALFTITLTAAPGASAASQVKIDQTFEKTNFTDADFNLISQTGVTFKDAFASINGPS